MQKLSYLRLTFVMALIMGGAIAPAQTSPEQQVSPSQSESKINLIVLDKKGHAIEDVRAEELEVSEDGIKQTITSFARDTRPLSYGLLVDNSGSLRTQFKEVISAARAIVQNGDERDQGFLVRFINSEKIDFVNDPTSDKAALVKALDSFVVEGGQTALVDAVYASATEIAKQRDAAPVERRRALILITDGEERGSIYKKEQLIKLLRESDTPVFVIGFVNELDKEGGQIRRSPREMAVGFLTELAKESGGRVFFPDSAKDLPWITDELMHSLHTQFLIGYTPALNPKSKPYRTLKVKLAKSPGRENRVAVARAGYTARLK